jgi:F-type H+-transporting ATPase subunit c
MWVVAREAREGADPLEKRRTGDAADHQLSRVMRKARFGPASLERRCTRGGCIPEAGEIIKQGVKGFSNLKDGFLIFFASKSLSATKFFFRGKIEMRKLRLVFFGLVGLLMSAAPVLAQATQAAADNESSVNKYKALAAGFGFAIAAGLGALGQSRIAASAVEGAARNPGAAGRIQTMMILGLALIESLVLFALLIVFVKV